jgi:ABC-type phosphate transport system substrate-binding protein
MATTENWNELWDKKSDREIAIGIRSQAEDLYDQIVELLQHMSDNAGIDINQAIKDDFVDLYQVFGANRDALQQFAADHPEFMGWRPPS